MRCVALVSLLLVGCASSPLQDPTLQPEPMPRSFLLLDADSPYVPRTSGVASLPGGSRPFTLRRERILASQTVPTGTVLHGLCVDESWIRPPMFADAWFWRPDFAMVKHVGDAHWTRLDLRTGQEERMPFRRLVTARRLAGVDTNHARVVGIDDDPSAAGLCTIWLLDRDWRIAAELPRVLPKAERNGLFWPDQPIEVLDKAYVVHHRNEACADVDVVYDLAGKPLSPPLEPLRRLAEEGSNGKVHFAIRTEPAADLYWPLHDDGTITPKPAHVAGIKVFERGAFDHTGHAPFVGGVVIGTVGDEERFAFVHPSNWYGQTAIEALAKSNFRAMEAVEYHYADPGHYDRNQGYSGGSLLTKLGFVVHRVAENDWHLVGPSGDGILGNGSPTREAAYLALARYTKENDATYLAESERRRQQYEYAMSWRERRDAAAARHEQAVRAAMKELEQKCKGTQVAEGLALARTRRDRDLAGAEAFVRFVLHCAEQTGTTVPTDDMECARRITTDPTLQDRLLSCLQRRDPQQYPPAAATSRDFGGAGGGSSGSGSAGGTSASPPVWSGPSVADTLSNARWSSQLSYLSGQTSSYWGSNGVNRR